LQFAFIRLTFETLKGAATEKRTMKTRLITELTEEELAHWASEFTVSEPVHFFQGPLFARLVVESRVYRHGLVVTEQEDGRWAGVLSFVLLHEHRHPLQVLTTRAVIYGGPVFSSHIPSDRQAEVTLALLTCLVRELKNRCLYIQFRNFYDTDKLSAVFRQQGFYFSDRLNLLKPLDDRSRALASLSATRRRQLRLSASNGLMVRPAKGVEEVDRFYDLLRVLYREKVRKPLPSRELFRRFFALSEHSSCGKILMAEYRGQLVGGILAPATPGGSIFEWYVCGLDAGLAAQRVYPSVSLTWAAMELGMEMGCHTFDFMGMGLPGKPYGVREFKARFGGQWVNYGRWTRINHPMQYRLIELAYNVFRMLKRV
jgi:hypothetical protein